ncbi:MAG: serine/threonine protein kinase, partial [Calditrichaeota bacterium]
IQQYHRQREVREASMKQVLGTPPVRPAAAQAQRDAAKAKSEVEHPAEPATEARPTGEVTQIEDLVVDSTEIKAMVETEAEEPASPEEPKQDKLEADDDDFLALIEDENTPAPAFDPQSEPTGFGSDATRTVDMSQFKVHKIGRYIIEKEIGRGAAGRVYKAWDPKLDRTVVIKTVAYSLTADEDEISRLKTRVYREAKTAAKLNHPNIVVVYDVEDEKSFSYIVMEHVEGPNLRQLLNQERRLPPARAISIVKQICKALQFAHSEGVVHRDIKPSNILIVGKEKIKVTDFGIAKVVNHLTLTQTGRVVGTPSYMAPEQIEGTEVDARADIFSLGVVFYELLTGVRPFVADSLASLAYKIVHVEPVPPSLVNLELFEIYDDIIGTAMAKDPGQRYQTAGEFLQALEKINVQIES